MAVQGVKGRLRVPFPQEKKDVRGLFDSRPRRLPPKGAQGITALPTRRHHRRHESRALLIGMVQRLMRRMLPDDLQGHQIVQRRLAQKNVVLDDGGYLVPLRLLSMIEGSPEAKIIKEGDRTQEHHRVEDILPHAPDVRPRQRGQRQQPLPYPDAQRQKRHKPR